MIDEFAYLNPILNVKPLDNKKLNVLDLSVTVHCHRALGVEGKLKIAITLFCERRNRKVSAPASVVYLSLSFEEVLCGSFKVVIETRRPLFVNSVIYTMFSDMVGV